MNTAVSGSAVESRPSKVLGISLWIAQVLLAAGFGMGGTMKATTPIAELTEKMAWAGAVPPELVRFIGASEIAAAIGLVLPSVTRIRPVLTPLAAAGLALIMVLAAGFHVMRGEMEALPINFVMGGLAAFVAWGRWRKAPIAPRA